MKLRNKKTGEIIETDFELSVSVPDDEKLYGNDTYTQIKGYSSIKELSEEWEDYEEPKKHWFIATDGRVLECNESASWSGEKAIGNYFETKEEAEKAVEKLKAYKRLKDKGFKFELWDYDGGNYQETIRTGRILFRVADDYPEKNIDTDLDLLFGSEE